VPAPGVDGASDPGASLHMPHCLLIFTIYECVHFIYAMPSSNAGSKPATAAAQPASGSQPAQ